MEGSTIASVIKDSQIRAGSLSKSADLKSQVENYPNSSPPMNHNKIVSFKSNSLASQDTCVP